MSQSDGELLVLILLTPKVWKVEWTLNSSHSGIKQWICGAVERPYWKLCYWISNNWIILPLLSIFPKEGIFKKNIFKRPSHSLSKSINTSISLLQTIHMRYDLWWKCLGHQYILGDFVQCTFNERWLREDQPIKGTK